jgi:predicted ATPase/class 3 adenylate cyclase
LAGAFALRIERGYHAGDARRNGGSREPPEGVVALLFTDIEGSTRLAARLASSWGGVLADHHALVGAAIAAEGGFVEGTAGDSFFAVFVDAAAATRAAVAALRGLRAHTWPAEVSELGVRMGLHVGVVERRATGYVGLEIHRAARVMGAAHGGQLLLTGAARALIGDVVPVELVGSHRLKDFPAPEQLFCAVVDGRGAAAFPPPRTERVRPTNLPAGAQSLVGRDADLERIRSAVQDDGERLVTLTGRGGVGKTSLALAVASGLLDEHPGGVWLVRLAVATAPEEVLPAIASVTGAEGNVAASALEAVIERLRGRGAVLLVLDNLEHLLGAAPALSDLLDALPALRMLITSQAPLRMGAERCLPVEALDDESALELIECVTRRQGRVFVAQGAERQALLDVVHVLDGLPLALELVAARLPVLSPAQLRERLPGSPELLRDAAAGRPERQRSLQATVEWTLGPLAEDARALFMRMGAFAGPAELEDIEVVAGGEGLDVLEMLAALLEVALVRRVESGDGRVRFGLPEALRQVASAMLDAAPDGQQWRRAHAQRQHDLLWAGPERLQSGPAWRAAIASDAEAAAALRWGRASRDALAAPLAAGRAMLLSDRRTREALALLEPLLNDPSGDPTVRAVASLAYGHALTRLGRFDESIAAASRALAITSDPTTQVGALIALAYAHSFRGDHAAGVRDGERAIAMARGVGPATTFAALACAAQSHVFAGQLEVAAERLAEAERIGATVDCMMMPFIRTFQGDLAMASGRLPEALEYYSGSVEVAEALGHGGQVVFDLLGVAHAFARLEADAEAIEIAGLAEAQAADVGGPGSTLPALPGANALVAAERRLGPAACTEFKARGRSMPVGSRVARACQLARERRPGKDSRET